MRKPYTEADRKAALGALMASAMKVRGEWRPHFTAVAEARGINDKTLRNWWSARDPAEDTALREAVTRARDAEWEGSREFLAWYRAGLIRQVQYLFHPHHYSTELVPVPFSDKECQLAGARIDHAVKAVDWATNNGEKLRAVLFGEEGSGQPDPVAAAREALQRTRLERDLKPPPSAPSED